MTQRIVAVVGGAAFVLMGFLGMVSGNDILPLWHRITSVIIGTVWIFEGLKFRLKTVRRINIILTSAIILFSAVEFVVPSFVVFSLGTGNQICSIHQYFSLAFGAVLLFIAVFGKLKKEIPIAVVLLAVFALAGCGNTFDCRYLKETFEYKTFGYPDISIDVISDIHLYDLSLGTTGKAFEDYISHDRKDLVNSASLFDQAVKAIKDLPGIVIIPGDLTKDGELSSHRFAATKLAELEKSGKKVFVTCGNHDINNPDAMRFTGDLKESVDTIQKDDFKSIYKDFGYSESVMADDNSLSYVAEPVPGLWLLAIDSTDPDENFTKGKPETNGRLTQARFDWIEKVHIEARSRGKSVIAMMHHGLLEHYEGQEKYFGMYLVDDGEEIARMLVNYGVKAVFTGHYHSTDITSKVIDGQTIYDIETGSLVSWPNAFRRVVISEGKMSVSTSWIKDLPGVASYHELARRETSNGIVTIGREVMESVNVFGLKMSQQEIAEINPQISEAFLAHYMGDEKFSGTDKIKYRDLSLVGKMVVGRQGPLVISQWHDLPPSDHSLVIDLATGEVVK